ncbi:16S rRNA (guanine(527)-N(7))-methyltransferase RsmG [Marinicellulosiphila megalodicopiae]|uniref:16S rRNA (guanine(527)-N(7))-methyltransferase RsmG n=1 Tax=Marinicellulosiphila megalodicopiae TaxID=2724896 RepID=UPI003BAF6317
MSQDFKARLERGFSELKLATTPEQVEQLLAYHTLLIKWNKAYNLTAIRDPMEMIDRHLVDSLGIIDFLDDIKRLIDVGTGGGMPGIIIAIMRPEIHVTLLDSNGKKTRFLQQVVMSLKLSNAKVVQSRLESFHVENEDLFDCITSRAFATLQDMVDKSHTLLASSGQYLAMKGINPVDEISQLPLGFKVNKVCPLSIPFADGQRHLVSIVRDAS